MAGRVYSTNDRKSENLYDAILTEHVDEFRYLLVLASAPATTSTLGSKADCLPTSYLVNQPAQKMDWLIDWVI